MGYAFREIKEGVDIYDVISRYMSLVKDGPHYRGKCIFHNDKTASLVVTPGKAGKKDIWKCFGCDKGGDVFDFLTEFGYSYKQAVDVLQNGDINIGVPFPIKEWKNEAAAPVTWTQGVPRSQPTTIEHPRYGVPNYYWPYHNEHGIIVSYDCRFNLEDGKKNVLPFTFCTDGKDSKWKWQGMDTPRLLSNRHLMAKQPERSVLIIEGRKTSEAAAKLLKTPIASTWQGGSNGVKRTDWTPLKGRKKIIWQDNDYAGYHASCEIRDILLEMGEDPADLLFVHNRDEWEKGWDIADGLAAGWTEEQARDYILSNSFAHPQIREDETKKKKATEAIADKGKAEPKIAAQAAGQQQDKTPPMAMAPAPTTAAAILQQEANPPLTTRGAPPVRSDPDADRNPYFRELGFLSNDGKLHHCFYSMSTKTIIKLTASGMAKTATLLELAPLYYWEENFAKKTGDFNLASAVDYLISISNTKGIFRPQNIRGRGAWLDNKRSVVHCGDYLLMDGKRVDLANYKGKYIYEQGEPIGFNADNPLSGRESIKFLELLKTLKWQRSVNAYLLAGWCVIAPYCGALKWRPHIWITGGAGTGKTWVLNNIIRPMLGDTCLRVQGSTSEAGLRQALRIDALPVAFDEAEGENNRDQDRMQNVLGLVRSASSEDGGNIVKGTSASGANSYQIRSCFAFASIALQLTQQSDRTRITILGMMAATGEEKDVHFAHLGKKQHLLMTPEYCARLQARTLLLLPVLLKNAQTFAAAAAAVLGQQRAGDQLGALLAGAYSLSSDKEISYDRAVDWLADKDWSEETALNETRDERNLFISIMDSIVSVEGAFSKYERTIGELVRVVVGLDPEDQHLTKASALMSMKRFGIALNKEHDMIIFSNTAKALKKALEHTPWSRNHNTLLMLLPGAIKIDVYRFGSGVSTRAVGVPLNYFTD